MRFFCGLHLFLLLVISCPALACAADPGAASLGENARSIFQASMEWGDRLWDPQARLLRADEVDSGRADRYTVRASSWYAFGLLARNGKGDDARALAILDAVLAQQYDAPGKP